MQWKENYRSSFDSMIIKNLTVYLSLFISFSIFGQDRFIIQPDGLSPEYVSAMIEGKHQSDLYRMTLGWLETNKQELRITIDKQVEGETIKFTSFKGNTVNYLEQYYHAEYYITIRFNEDGYQFECTEINLKLNSKYDMGWKSFDLEDASGYFKKGRIIRKYKSYVLDLPDRLNELNLGLHQSLTEQ
jgi:hypothetical protein